MGRRANPAVAGVLCLGLIAACSSSDPAPSATPAASLPATTPAVVSAPATSEGATTSVPARRLDGTPMTDCTVASEPR